MTILGSESQHVANEQYYDLFSENYEKRRHHGYHLMLDDLESDLIIPHCRNNSILEVGCGTGLILQRTAAVARHAVGIDLSAGMLKHASEKGLNVQQASATSLPFAENEFDLAYSFKVLSHIPQLDKALSEMGRVVRAEGKVFAELYNRSSFRYAARRMRGGHKIAANIHDNQVFVKFYSLDEMISNLPENLNLKRIHGVRIFTTLPSMVSWPVCGSILRAAERRAMSTWLARFGGFLVLECEKTA
ncbi:MAG: class I SAM-dependent methyltransferase [Planctomycetaceae bacterium]|nr:class I SAM-dependent methyltransferase [Planctomycetaceae bacterium]